MLSLHNEPYIIKHILIDLNLAKLIHYPFMISLPECGRSCNTADASSTKICVPSKTEDLNGKVFNMITINEAKTLIKHI